MEPAPTILAELGHYLKEEALTITQFAERSGLHSGTLSNVIHGLRPIAMQQLDRITEAMGLAEGYFYDLYIDNYIIEGSPDWRRIGPLLHRCAELDKLDAIQRIVGHIMDNLMYLPLLFNTAEELFIKGYYTAASILYKIVAEGEKSQHSERLALCQYRLFTLSLCDDQNVNLLAAVHFEPYVERLDEAYQLDALNELINANGSIQRWDKVEQLAEKMGHKASIYYETNSIKDGFSEKLKKPLIFYILYAYLARANAWRENGNYEKALYYVSLYAENSWIKEPSDIEKGVINQFSQWAEANRYMYQLLNGNVEILPDYVNYIAARENEIFPGLCKIILAANKYNINVDDILELFDDYLGFKWMQNQIGRISHQVTAERYTRLLAELGIYYLNAKIFDKGIFLVLESLESSIKINSDSAMLRCIGLYEQFREYASDQAQEKYKILIREVQTLNEKKIGFSTHYL
ncbi:helix-turn-helix transcriptional regulator [Paenibacillus albidus]|nr:helix-turn-helix transcriptional regulator [Paenibacillus albidus]